MRKVFLAVRLTATYIRAKLIILFSQYDEAFFADGSRFKGGRFGKFTAPGWKWVIHDYKMCKAKGVNQDVPWPVSADIRIVGPENISFHPDDLNNFQTFGNYYQAIERISIGKGTYIAPNVGIITANHSLEDISKHGTPKPVTLGERCWIGMNAMILPGVSLGDNTVVGAGSVVTKSFPEGNCVIAGNPAKMIRVLKRDDNGKKLEGNL